MKKTNFFRILSTAVLILALTACGESGPGSTDAESEGGGPTAYDGRGRILTIGTGDVGGSLYPIGSAIAKVINDNIKGVKANVETTGGSVDNSRMVGEGEIDLGLSAGDTAYLAQKGEGMFAGRGQEKIRSLFAYNQSTSIWLTPVSSGIENIAQLKGKRIITGMPGSGTEQGVSFVLPAASIAYPDDIKPQYIGVQEGCDAIRNGQADAFFGLGGMPQGAILDLTNERECRFLPYDEALLDKITSDRPYYFKTTLPKGMFKGQDIDISTFGVKSECLVSADLDEELAYQITKAVWEHITEMYDAHSSLRYMTPDFVASGLAVPLHPGAERYWREVGIIK